LRIRNACEDTCPECFILKNIFKYLGSRRQEQGQDEVSLPDDAALPVNITADEFLLFNANLHAEQAQQQQNLAADRQHQALEESNIPHAERRFVVVCISSSPFFLCANKIFFSVSYCMVCVCAQNLGLPHFGAEQPAGIYYFSELTVNIFGIADVTKFWLYRRPRWQGW
jgi:hypothetical protein